MPFPPFLARIAWTPLILLAALGAGQGAQAAEPVLLRVYSDYV